MTSEPRYARGSGGARQQEDGHGRGRQSDATRGVGSASKRPRISRGAVAAGRGQV